MCVKYTGRWPSDGDDTDGDDDDDEEEDDDDAFPFPTSMTPKRVSTYCTWSGSVIASGTALELWRVGFANAAASKLNVARNCMRRSIVSASSSQMHRDKRNANKYCSKYNYIQHAMFEATWHGRIMRTRQRQSQCRGARLQMKSAGCKTTKRIASLDHNQVFGTELIVRVVS